MTATQSTQEQIILAGAQALAAAKNEAGRNWNASAKISFRVNVATKLQHNEPCKGSTLFTRLFGKEFA